MRHLPIIIFFFVFFSLKGTETGKDPESEEKQITGTTSQESLFDEKTEIIAGPSGIKKLEDRENKEIEESNVQEKRIGRFKRFTKIVIPTQFAKVVIFFYKTFASRDKKELDALAFQNAVQACDLGKIKFYIDRRGYDPNTRLTFINPWNFEYNNRRTLPTRIPDDWKTPIFAGSALGWTTLKGRADIIELLIKCNADVNLTSTISYPSFKDYLKQATSRINLRPLEDQKQKEQGYKKNLVDSPSLSEIALIKQKHDQQPKSITLNLYILEFTPLTAITSVPAKIWFKKALNEEKNAIILKENISHEEEKHIMRLLRKQGGKAVYSRDTELKSEVP
ncbi:MAG: hypothetical protein WA432_02955 [Candidatus Babeliaceae bacterium]